MIRYYILHDIFYETVKGSRTFLTSSIKNKKKKEISLFRVYKYKRKRKKKIYVSVEKKQMYEIYNE